MNQHLGFSLSLSTSPCPCLSLLHPPFLITNKVLISLRPQFPPACIFHPRGSLLLLLLFLLLSVCGSSVLLPGRGDGCRPARSGRERERALLLSPPSLPSLCFSHKEICDSSPVGMTHFSWLCVVFFRRFFWLAVRSSLRGGLLFLFLGLCIRSSVHPLLLCVSVCVLSVSVRVSVVAPEGCVQDQR